MGGDVGRGVGGGVENLEKSCGKSGERDVGKMWVVGGGKILGKSCRKSCGKWVGERDVGGDVGRGCG